MSAKLSDNVDLEEVKYSETQRWRCCVSVLYCSRSHQECVGLSVLAIVRLVFVAKLQSRDEVAAMATNTTQQST